MSCRDSAMRIFSNYNLYLCFFRLLLQPCWANALKMCEYFTQVTILVNYQQRKILFKWVETT